MARGCLVGCLARRESRENPEATKLEERAGAQARTRAVLSLDQHHQHWMTSPPHGRDETQCWRCTCQLYLGRHDHATPHEDEQKTMAQAEIHRRPVSQYPKTCGRCGVRAVAKAWSARRSLPCATAEGQLFSTSDRRTFARAKVESFADQQHFKCWACSL